MFGSPARTRTTDILINSQTLYQLSYRGIDFKLNKTYNQSIYDLNTI